MAQNSLIFVILVSFPIITFAQTPLEPEDRLLLCGDGSFPKCPDGWIQFENPNGVNSCYRLSGIKKKKDAEETCQGWGGLICDRQRTNSLENLFTFEDTDDTSFNVQNELANGGGNFKQQNRLWSRCKFFEKRLNDYGCGQRFPLLSVPPTTPFVYDSATPVELTPKFNPDRLCTAHCECNPKNRPSIIGTAYTFIRANCRTTMYHALCGIFGTECDDGTNPGDGGSSQERSLLDDDESDIPIQPSMEALLANHDPSLDDPEAHLYNESDDEASCQAMAEAYQAQMNK